MALARAVADVLAADSRFGTFGGDGDWALRVNLMTDEPADQVAVYERPNTDESATKETGAVRIIVRGRDYETVTAKAEAAVDVLAGQPLAGWLAWSHNGLEALEEGDQRRPRIATEITFRELCDTVTIDLLRRKRTSLSYRTVTDSTLSDVPALIARETGQRETYRGARVETTPITVYTKATGSLSPGQRVAVRYGRDLIDIDAIHPAGVGCARNVLVLTGMQRRPV